MINFKGDNKEEIMNSIGYRGKSVMYLIDIITLLVQDLVESRQDILKWRRIANHSEDVVNK